MIFEVVVANGKHMVETLPSGAISGLQWIPRPVEDEFEEWEPEKLTIAAHGVDVVSCREFGAQLVRDDNEVLVTVFCDGGMVEALALVNNKAHTASLLRRGFYVRSIWEVLGDEF
jgi:hypothetical protein